MWIEQLNKEDLVALIPPQAVKAGPDRAARIVAEQMARRDVVLKPVSTKFKAAKKTAKKVVTRRTAKAAKKAASLPKYQTLYQAIKTEFWELICTKSSKYSALRKNLNKHGSNGTVIVVSMIAAAIGSLLNITAGICVPFISILLLTLLNVGTNAYCGLFPST